MFKTLISKFTVLFWLLFVVVIIPIYFYANFHFSAVLQTSEKEKITLTFNTLKPMIALNLSFNQQEFLEETLNSFFEHHDIQTIQLNSIHGETFFFKSKQNGTPKKSFLYESTILDPFSNAEVATATVTYTNEHLEHLMSNILLLLFLIFGFALIIFLLGFYYLHDDLKGLRLLSERLKQYTVTKDLEVTDIPGKSLEVRTIATVANQMVSNLSNYVRQLKLFNQELEQRVEDAVIKQRDQERLMIHQSRQAAMGEMLESIAHQWRQPLNNIGLAASNIETKYAFGSLNDKEFDDKMQIISANINYMSDTIDDFRNFLNPDGVMHTFIPEQSIQDIFMILDAQLQNNNIAHTIKSSCHLQLHGTENEFKQVLLILINNAKDAIKGQMSQKRIDKGAITISLSCMEGHGIIEVSDNGGGIDEKILHSIFEPYFTTKFQNKGTGIGLYMARNIIEKRMEGSLTMKNIKSGSCFTIKLPMQEEESS
ncbi:MAG: HAMP domain-containing sensor histidine kinase [Campylobacterota bacterium]|nr:HAMP domain-containing sensor histidine kinase [Campylobacterota bacterium]